MEFVEFIQTEGHNTSFLCQISISKFIFNADIPVLFSNWMNQNKKDADANRFMDVRQTATTWICLRNLSSRYDECLVQNKCQLSYFEVPLMRSSQLNEQINSKIAIIATATITSRTRNDPTEGNRKRFPKNSNSTKKKKKHQQQSFHSQTACLYSCVVIRLYAAW